MVSVRARGNFFILIIFKSDPLTVSKSKLSAARAREL